MTDQGAEPSGHMAEGGWGTRSGAIRNAAEKGEDRARSHPNPRKIPLLRMGKEIHTGGLESG
jgi:hypothetical protein